MRGTPLSEVASEELLATWDYDKNYPLTPDDVAKSSKKKMWWCCDKGHSYDMSVLNRVRYNHGCPYCSGRRVLVGFNDLATTHPDLAAEWDYARNYSLKPTDVTYGQALKVWWICDKCGYRWCATINSRSRSTCSRGCPKCGIKSRAQKKTKSHEQFIREMQAINPNVDILGQYVRSDSPIKARCKKCGFVWATTTPDNFIQGSGCPKCGREKMRQSHIKSHDDFIAELARVRPDLEVLGEYTGRFLPILVRCRRCGRTWSTKPSVLFASETCFICASRRRRKTHEQFLRELGEVNPGVEVLDRYVLSGEAVTARCKRCGRTWETTPNRLLRPSGCPWCSHHYRTHEMFVAELARYRSDVKVLDRYEKVKSPMRAQCLVCGCIWVTTPDYLLHSAGCPDCYIRGLSERTRLSHAVFLSRLESINANVEVLSEYKGQHYQIRVRCVLCGNEWNTAAGNLLAGRGCPECAKKYSTSFPEQSILYYLSKVVVAESRCKIGGKEVDVWLPNSNVAVEYNGVYWHKEFANRSEHDALKREIVEGQGFRLIVVSDGHEQNQVLQDEIRIVNQDKDLDWAIERLFDMLGLLCPDIDTKRDRVEIKAQYKQ